MALKFLNKKGWHTGSLRNIENVWKAEQKHDAEQKKLEELRKQIHEERDRAEFRQLQEQAGLISGQERLEFLYDSGLAVGKGSSSFQALDSLPKTDPQPTASSSTPATKEESLAPGALFEEKPQSANDAWRKLHSDPLLMIRQREQEALARIKNNPVKMAMIRNSVETKKIKDKDEKKHRKKHHRKKSKHHAHSSSGNDSDSEDPALTVEKQRESRHRGYTNDKLSSKRAHSDEESSEGDTRKKKYISEKPSRKRAHSDEESSEGDTRRKKYTSDKPSSKRAHSDEESSEGDTRRKKYYDKEYKDRRPSDSSNLKYDRSNDQQRSKKNDYDSQCKEHYSERHVDPRRHTRSYSNTSDKPPRHELNVTSNPKYDRSNDQQRNKKNDHDSQGKEYSSERHSDSRHDTRSYSNTSDKPPRPESNIRRRNPVKLSEEERAARLREMQMDAEVHEEQRWKRLKKAADSDAEEAIRDRSLVGRNFLDAAQKSVYGAEKGGSSTIEESVRRRMHYSQRGSTSDSNAFRRS